MRVTFQPHRRLDVIPPLRTSKHQGFLSKQRVSQIHSSFLQSNLHVSCPLVVSSKSGYAPYVRWGHCNPEHCHCPNPTQQAWHLQYGAISTAVYTSGPWKPWQNPRDSAASGSLTRFADPCGHSTFFVFALHFAIHNSEVYSYLCISRHQSEGLLVSIDEELVGSKVGRSASSRALAISRHKVHRGGERPITISTHRQSLPLADAYSCFVCSHVALLDVPSAWQYCIITSVHYSKVRNVDPDDSLREVFKVVSCGVLI